MVWELNSGDISTQHFNTTASTRMDEYLWVPIPQYSYLNLNYTVGRSYAFVMITLRLLSLKHSVGSIFKLLNQ